MKTRLLCAVIGAILWTATASAQGLKGLSCELSTEVTSRPMFTSAGLFASRHAAQISDLYCGYPLGHDDKLYVDIWNLTPYGRFADGGEVDFRVGYSKNVGRWNFDMSVAEYNFRVDGLGVLNSLNARGKTTYNFDVGQNLVLRVYGIVDFQHSFNFHPAHAFAVAGGVYGGVKMLPKVELGVGAEVWQYATNWTDNPHATVVSVVPQVSYEFDKNVTLYAKAAFVTGSIIRSENHGWKQNYTVGVTLKF
mgnify:CR=1 FL=1